MRVWNLIRGGDVTAHRRKRITRFSALPLTVGELKVTSTHIIETGVAEYIIESAISAHTLGAATDNNCKFGFVIDLRAGSWQDDWRAGRNYRRREFRKHHRSFRNCHLALSSVVSIIESDAN